MHAKIVDWLNLYSVEIEFLYILHTLYKNKYLEIFQHARKAGYLFGQHYARAVAPKPHMMHFIYIPKNNMDNSDAFRFTWRWRAAIQVRRAIIFIIIKL